MATQARFYKQLAQQQQEGGDPAPKATDGLGREEFTNIMGQVVDVLARVEHSIKESRQPRSEPTPAPAPKPTPQPKPQASAADAVNALLAGDIEPLKGLLQGQQMDPGEFGQMKEKLDQLVQFATLQATEAIPQNEAHFRQQVDTKYGEGAYDKIFKEGVDAKFEGQPGLRANRTHFANVVNLVAGERIDDLVAHKAEADAAAKEAASKKEAEQAQYPFMLGGGVPISMKEGKVQFDAEDEQWMQRYELVNGEPFDREGASKMMGALAQTSAGKPMLSASIDELDKFFPAAEESQS